jgi:hypothetical protein
VREAGLGLGLPGSADELNALADFYSSRHGASVMAKFGACMADVTPPITQEVTLPLKTVALGILKASLMAGGSRRGVADDATSSAVVGAVSPAG